MSCIIPLDPDYYKLVTDIWGKYYFKQFDLSKFNIKNIIFVMLRRI